MDADEEAIEAFAQRKATTALILAILGFVCLPGIASLGAVIVGHQARGMYRDHPEYQGAGLVIPALVLGWIGLVAGTIVLIYVFR